MARTSKSGPTFHPESLQRLYGRDEFTRGMKKMFDSMAPDEKKKMLDDLMSSLTAKEREGSKRSRK